MILSRFVVLSVSLTLESITISDEGDIPVWSDDGPQPSPRPPSLTLPHSNRLPVCSGGKTYSFSTGVYKPGMDECNIAQAANGSLMLIARNCWCARPSSARSHA